MTQYYNAIKGGGNGKPPRISEQAVFSYFDKLKNMEVVYMPSAWKPTASFFKISDEDAKVALKNWMKENEEKDKNAKR